MRIFHKQLIILLLVFAVIFVPSTYFAFWALHDSIHNLTAESAGLMVWHFNNVVSKTISAADSQQTLSKAQHFELRQALVAELSALKSVRNVLLVNRWGEIVFSLSPIMSGSKYSLDWLQLGSSNSRGSNFHLRSVSSLGAFEAVWPLATPHNLYGVLELDSSSGELGVSLSIFKNQFIVVGASGFLAVVFLAFVAARLIKSPVRNIERALTRTEKGQFGLRLQTKRSSEFADVYEQINRALNKLEKSAAAQQDIVDRKNELQRQLDRNERFLSILAHEISNPLHALAINVDVLKTKIMQSHSDESKLKYAQIIDNELGHLQEIIQGFLTFARPGVPKKERIQINQIVADVCEAVSAEAEKAEVKIDLQLSNGLREVSVDKNHLQQALHNIVINAIHATAANGRVYIRTGQKRKYVTVSIKDTGTGMTKDELAKIFDIFYTTKKGGSGIGLPVSQRMIEVNGGQIEIESAVGKGTHVKISLPWA